MVKRCVNPDCLNEFRHMNMGDLYALECGVADTRFVWLCGECAPKFAVAVDSDGVLSVRPRAMVSQSRIVPANHSVRLRLISGPKPPDPWHRAGISGVSDAFEENPIPLTPTIQAA